MALGTSARLNVARLGNFRLGAGPKLTVFVDGTERKNNFDRRSVRITDAIEDEPNTASLEVFGFVPAVGEEIVIGRYEAYGTSREFRGTITDVRQLRWKLNQGRVVYRLQCVDWTPLLGTRIITASYASTSASTIAAAIMALAPSGFTSTRVESGLATITTQFKATPLNDALTQLARHLGASWYIDLDKDLHFFVTAEVDDLPLTIDATNTRFWDLEHAENIDQVWNQIIVEGRGSSVLSVVDAGDTIIPLEDATDFASSSTNYACIGNQELTYTGKAAGGTGSTVAGVTQGPSAPVAASAGNQDGRLGVGAGYTYKVAFEGAPGESEVSSASNSVTLSAVSAPGAATAALASGAGRVTAGNHAYKVAFVNANGETLPGTASNTVAAVDFSAPGALSVAAVATTIGYLIGAYGYKVTFVTSLGETAGGTLASKTATAQSAPSAPTENTKTDDGGLYGAYTYKISYVSAIGETLGSAGGTSNPALVTPATPTVSGTTGTTYYYKVTWETGFGESNPSATQTAGNGAGAIGQTVNRPSGQPTGARWRIYRSNSGTTGVFRFIAEVASGTSTYVDNIADADLGEQAPATGTMGQRVALAITTGPTGTLARRIYRTIASGSTYYLVGEVQDNSTTSFTDTVPDTALTVLSPLQNLNGERHSLTSIPTGATGTLARRIYRTVAGGSDYKFLTEIGDNSTTTYTDNTPDEALGESVPLVNTAGASSVTLSSVPTGSAGTTARRIYRTLAGGSVYYRVGTISDNVTTSFTDDVSDNTLQSATSAPSVSTADGGKIDLSSIPTGPSGTTKRRLYRTAVGGSAYKYLATIQDNSTTTYTDNIADTSLGDDAPSESQWGASAAQTTLGVQDLAQFPAAGWAQAGSQILRYTARSGSSGVGTLTGVPASGTGAIAASIAFGTAVTAVPAITGVSGLTAAIVAGDELNTWTISDDAGSQATYGVRKKYLQDRRLSRASAAARGAAELAIYAEPRIVGSLKTNDPQANSGKPLTIDMNAEWGISGTFTIMSVDVSMEEGKHLPQRTVTFGNVRNPRQFFSILRSLEQQQET